MYCFLVIDKSITGCSYSKYSQLDLANMAEGGDQIPDTLTSVSECGFCCVKAEDMTEPRTMPCGHIYCAPCIEGHVNPVTAETECKICRYM